MPYAPHFRVSALGRIGNGAERFSYGINVQGSGDPRATEAGWTDVAGDIKTFHTSVGAGIAAHCVLESVKVASIGPDGKYLHDALEIAITGGAGSGNGGGVFPPQIALSVSLLTNRRGPGGRGRLYLPCPTYNVDATNGFQISAGAAGLVATAVRDLLNNIRNAPGLDNVNNSLDPLPVVASTKGTNTEIIGVRVGRVLDTIRSRRGALAENYTSDLLLS